MQSYKQSIGNAQKISLDDICHLISVISTQDEIGQPIKQEKEYLVFCSKLSITRAEFNAAGQLGFKPEMMLILDSETYNNESLLEYNQKKYTVYKTFPRSDGFTELYCEVKSGG